MAGVHSVVGVGLGVVGQSALCGSGIGCELPLSLRSGRIGLWLWPVRPLPYQSPSHVDAPNNVGG